MSRAITFRTSSERIPTLIASMVFLVPGVGAVVIGVLTWFSLTWIANPANGLLLGITGLIWAGVGIGILSFRRWITIDPDKGVVEQGTRTVFLHPLDTHPIDAFRGVGVLSESVADQPFFVVALVWKPEQRPKRLSHQDSLWLTTVASADEARSEAARVVAATGLGLLDRTGAGA